MADRLERSLTREGVVAAPQQIHEQLLALRRVLIFHTEQEDERLYPALFNHPNDGVRQTARSLHAEFGIIYAAVEVFIGVWTRPGALEAEPDRFVAETTGILVALRARITQENEQLYAVIDAV